MLEFTENYYFLNKLPIYSIQKTQKYRKGYKI